MAPLRLLKAAAFDTLAFSIAIAAFSDFAVCTEGEYSPCFTKWQNSSRPPAARALEAETL